MSDELDDPVIVDFPLRGEGWMAVTMPAARIASHGTDVLGERYAYDSLKVDARPGVNVHPAGSVLTSIVGVRTQECYAWAPPCTHPSTATSYAPWTAL